MADNRDVEYGAWSINDSGLSTALIRVGKATATMTIQLDGERSYEWRIYMEGSSMDRGSASNWKDAQINVEWWAIEALRERDKQMTSLEDLVNKDKQSAAALNNYRRERINEQFRE